MPVSDYVQQVQRILAGHADLPQNIQNEFLFAAISLVYEQNVEIAKAQGVANGERKVITQCVAKLEDDFVGLEQDIQALAIKLNHAQKPPDRNGARERASDKEFTERIKLFIFDKAEAVIIAFVIWFLLTILPQLIKGLP